MAFPGSMLSVNGEYAAVSDTILPASMGGAKQTGSVLFLNLAKQQGKVISVESGDESGIAAVSADGQYIVTCAGGDSPSGTLRPIRSAMARKLRMKPIRWMQTASPMRFGSSVIPPMQPWVRMTAMPSHRRLTFREEYMMKLELESITNFMENIPRSKMFPQF